MSAADRNVQRLRWALEASAGVSQLEFALQTCRSCPRPARPGRYLVCIACDIRSKLKPSTVCALRDHDRCGGLVDGEYDQCSAHRGEPCGCWCHAEEFDPAGVHPDKHGPWEELLADLLGEWRRERPT